MKIAFYFGCIREPGHFLFCPELKRHYDPPEGFPCKIHILDGGLLPPGLPQVEGRASTSHINGWTIMSFWDRSVDARYGCNSNFVLKGKFEFEEILQNSRYYFAPIFSRFAFPIFDHG